MKSESPQTEKEKAVALQYSSLEELPKITASGIGEIAKQIIAVAREHNVPLQEDALLAGMLSELQVGESVSPASFDLVAQVISFLYHTDKEWQEKHPFLTAVLPEPEEIG